MAGLGIQRISLILKRMKNWILLLTAVCLSWAAASQKHFIYIQSENNAPFYTKMGDKILSSTFSGYVIISSLADSTYNIGIGYAGKNGESKFRIEVRGKDRGFLIKEIDGVMNLFDLQELTLLKPVTEKTSSKYSYQKRDDAFTQLLAKAANDSSLLYVRVEIEEPKKEEGKDVVAVNNSEIKQKTDTVITTVVNNIQPVDSSISNPAVAIEEEPKKMDSVIAETAKPTVEEKKDSIIAIRPLVDSASVQQKEIVESNTETLEQEEYKRSNVTQRSESSTTEGFGLVFWDEQNGAVDTIRILIPNPKMIYKNMAEDSHAKQEKKFLDITDSVAITIPKQDTVAVEKIRCSNVASSKDFLDLRKAMAAQEVEKDMINEADKVFKEKCFNTEQLKNLSSLFLSEEIKLLFFQSAYKAVSDKEKFPSLQSELKEETNLNRFKLIVQQ
jgi:hypothetical protein